MPQENRPKFSAARAMAEFLVALIGAGLVIGALAATPAWFDRHFLPDFFTPHHVYLQRLSVLRGMGLALGLIFMFWLRPRAGRLAARVPPGVLAAQTVAIILAVTLALGASEMILRSQRAAKLAELRLKNIPPRQTDGKLGWTHIPGHSDNDRVGGRLINYTFDAAGYRVGQAGEAVNPTLPTILFTGESIILGEGLNWAETIPAETANLTHLQSANIAVAGYSTDQTYLRLAAELPRFRHPVAVVSIFSPVLFARNLRDYRPHLTADLEWRPAQHPWQLAILAKGLVPYWSRETIDRGITVTRAVLCATQALARAHGAVPILLVPILTPEAPNEQALRRRILDEAGLPYVLVTLDPSWRIPGDLHPDPRAAHAIAVAIAARLQTAPQASAAVSSSCARIISRKSAP